jgi:FemAB-related protein (PEP-CTERM system-associated)
LNSDVLDALGASARAAQDATVREATDSDAVAWNAFVETAPDASIYHRYEWRHVVQSVFSHETHYLLVWADNRVRAVLPLVRLTSRLFGDFMVSLPYFNYGGVLADSPEFARLLIDQTAELGRDLGVSHVELRHRANSAASLPSRTDKVTMLLRLPGSAEKLWKSVGWKVRGQVNQARKFGAESQRGGAELLPEFYSVFSENMRDLGTPVYPRRFFKAILDAFPENTRLFVVRHARKPVAAGFVIRNGRTLEIPWASSVRRANSMNVNMLLYWNVLEDACEQGIATFDFGRCTVDSGTYVFKKKWGAEPLQLFWHYWLRAGGEPPRLNHSNPKYQMAIAMWRKLPLPIANWLGPSLSQKLP